MENLKRFPEKVEKKSSKMFEDFYKIQKFSIEKIIEEIHFVNKKMHQKSS